MPKRKVEFSESIGKRALINFTMESTGEWAFPKLEIRPYTIENAPDAFKEMIREEIRAANLERRREAKAKKARSNGA